jgi:hypothetical protein
LPYVQMSLVTANSRFFFFYLSNSCLGQTQTVDPYIISVILLLSYEMMMWSMSNDSTVSVHHRFEVAKSRQS